MPNLPHPPLAIKQDNRPIESWIKDLQAGTRFCTACGQVNIPKEDPAWKTKCLNCFQEERQAKFCKECGDYLEQNRIDFARLHKNECQICYWCKKGNYKFRPEFGVKAPDHWFDSPSSECC